MIVKYILRFTVNDCVEVIKSLIFTISLACLSSINWASSDWNIAIGIHGNQWEVVTQNAKLPKIKTVYAVAENLREGYGYWARTLGEKKLRPLPSSLKLPLILEITKPGLAFVNPGLLKNESPQSLFSSENGIEFVWQYDPTLKQWSYFSPINASSGDAVLMQELIAGLPFWVKTSRAHAQIKPPNAITIAMVEGGSSAVSESKNKSTAMFIFPDEIDQKFNRKVKSKKRRYKSRIKDIPDGLNVEIVSDFKGSDSLKKFRVSHEQPNGFTKIVKSYSIAGKSRKSVLNLAMSQIGKHRVKVQLAEKAEWKTVNEFEWEVQPPAKGYLALFERLQKAPQVVQTFSSVSSQKKSYLESDQVQEIRVRVSGPLMQPMEQVFDGFPSTGVLNVPPGLNREITVDFLDYYGDVVVSGSSTVNLTSVNNSGPIQVNLERQPLSLPTVNLQAPEPGLYMAPLQLGVQANGTQIVYTLDGSDPKQANNDSVTVVSNTLQLSLIDSAIFRYFVQSDQGVRSGVETLQYTVVPPPEVNIQFLDDTLDDAYLEKSRVRLIASKNDTIIYYTTDGSEPNKNSSFKLGLANFHFTEDTTIRYFAESSAGFRSDLSTATVDIVELEDLTSISLNVPSSDLYMAPLSLDIAANGVQIIYTLDGSNPKNVQNQAVQSVSDQLELSLEHNTSFRYFLLWSNGVNSKVRNYQYEVAPPPNISLEVLDPDLNGIYLERVKIKFGSLHSGTTVFYTLDGSQPNQTSLSDTAPFNLIFNQNVTINYLAKSSAGFLTETETAQFTVIPDPIITEQQLASSMAPIETLQLQGLQFPGQEIKVKINQVLKSDSVEVNAAETGFNIALGDLQQGSNLVRIEKHSSDGELLKAIEFNLMKPVVNEHLGFVGFDMPTTFFSLNRVGGAVSIDYDEVDQELVFYNSEQGVLFKRDSQNVMRLLTYLPNVSSENLQINSEDQFFRKIFPYPMVSRDGVQYVAGQKGNFTRFSYDTYEPEPEIGLVVIRKFDGHNVINIAGHNAEPVDSDIAPRLIKDIDTYPGAKVFIPDTSFVGTNKTTAADALLLSSELYGMVEIQGKIYFNQGNAIYKLDPSNNTIRWMLGSPDDDSPVVSQITMPSSTLTGNIQNLEKYDNSSLAISLENDQDNNDSVYLYKVVVEGSSAGNFELLGTFGGGSDSIAGKNNFDPSKARLELSHLMVHQQVPYFLAAPDDQANNSQNSEPPSLYKINAQGLAEKLMDPLTGFAETPAAINYLRHSPLALFSVGSDILMLNVHRLDMPDAENDTDSENEAYSPAQVAASNSESAESGDSSQRSDSDDSQFSENFDFELEYSLLKPDGRVEFLMGSYGLFETGLIKETLLWPNGDMTLLLGPEPQTSNQPVDMNQKDMMDGYVVFHKKLGKSIPIYEISSHVYTPSSGEPIAELIPWFNTGDIRILSIRGVGKKQRLIAINPVNRQAINIGFDSDEFEEYLAEVEDQTGSRPSLDQINNQPRAGSLDLNTLKYAADNQLGLKDIALPDINHLDFSFDWQNKKLVILVKSETELSFYEVNLRSQNLTVTALFTSDQLSLGTAQNDYTFDLPTTEIFLLGDELAITSNGSVIRVDLNDLNLSEIVMISSADTLNADNFSTLVEDLNVIDVVAKQDGRVFSLIEDLSYTGNISNHFIAQMIDLYPRAVMGFGSPKQGLPPLGVNARTKIHGKYPSELKLLLGEPELLVSNNHLFLLGRGAEHSGLLVIDERQPVNLNVSVNNLSIQDSQSQTVEANDVIEFTYNPANIGLDLFFEIGGNPVSYETGVAQLEVNPYTHGFSGTLLAGGVAKDRYGRNSQIFPGHNSGLTYAQDIMDFVPETSDLELIPESDLIEIFANQVNLNVEASAYTTAIEVNYLSTDGSALPTITYIVWQDNDQAKIQIQQMIPDNVVEISLKGLNPKGKSDAILVEIDRIESVALTGLQGDQVHLSSNRIPVKMVRPHPYGLSLVPDRIQSFNGSHPFSIYDVQIDQIPYGQKIFDSNDNDRFIGSELIQDLFQIQYLTFFLRKPSEFSAPEKVVYMGLEDSNDAEIISALKLSDRQETPHKLANLNQTNLIVSSLDSNNTNKLHVVDIADLIGAGQNKQQIESILNSGLTIAEIPLQFAGSSLQSKTIDFLNSSGSRVYLGLSDASKKWVFEIFQTQGSIQIELLLHHNPFPQASSLDDSYESFILDEREFDKITSFHYTDDKYFMSLRKDASSYGGPIYQWSIEPFDGNPETLEGQTASGYAKLYLKSNEADHELEETFRKPVDSGAFGTVDMSLTSLGLLRLDSEGNLSMMTQEFIFPVQVNNEYSNRHFDLESFERIATTFREPISMATEDLSSDSYGLYMLGEEGELYYLDQSVGMVYQATDYDYESITNHPDTYQNEGLNLAATADGRVYELEFSDWSVQRTLLLTLPVGNRELSMIQLEGDYLYAAVDGKLYEYDLNSSSFELIIDISDHSTYGGYKIVGFASAGYSSDISLLHIEQKEYNDTQSRVVETADGKNFRTRSYSPRSMSSDHNKVYILESHRLREIDRQSLRITDTALDNNQQMWNSFQPVHTKLPASSTNYYFSSFLDSSNYAIQEMPVVGTQLRKISNDVIFSDVSVNVEVSKTGILSNGDQITFEVQLLDEFGDAFAEAPGFSAVARFNGQQLDWQNSSVDTKRATYTVSARDPLDNDPQLHSLMIVTEDGSISNYGSFVVSGVTAIEPNRNSISDWSVINVAYQTSSNNDDPEIVVEVKQSGASIAEDAILLVESPKDFDLFEVNHNSVNSNQILSYSFSLDSSSPLNLGTGIEPEGDWYFTWIPMIDSDEALDDAARDNNTKHKYYNQTPSFNNLPPLITFNRLNDTRYLYLDIDDEDYCSTQVSLLSAGDSAIASVKLMGYECEGQLEIKSVDYGITTFSLRLVDQEGKGITYISQVEVQTDHITSSIKSLRILPEQRLQIPFSVVLDPNASYAFSGSHSNTGIVSSFGSLVGTGSPNFEGYMTLVAGTSLGSDTAQIQLFRNNLLVNTFDINVQVTDEPYFSNPQPSYFSDGTETITTNDGYATTFYLYNFTQQKYDYYIAGIDGEGFRDGLSLKIDSNDNGYPSDILYFQGSYYVLWSVYNNTTKLSELHILKLDEDGLVVWRRVFDLNGHSFWYGRLQESRDSKLLVSFYAHDWDEDSNLMGWQKLSGNETAADTKFINYPNQITAGDYLEYVELHEHAGEILMTWLEEDNQFTDGSHLMASRWNSINQSQLSSSQLLSTDLIINSMGITSSLTSAYFFSRQVSVNTSNQITDTKLSVIQFSSGQVKEEYEIDMGTAFDTDDAWFKMSIDIQEDGLLVLGTSLYDSEVLSQASKTDPLAVYGLVLDHDLNEKFSLFRVDSQTSDRDGNLKDLEYLGNGLWAYAWNALNYTESNRNSFFSKSGEGLVRIFDTNDMSFFSTMSFTESNVRIDSMELQKLEDDFMIIIDTTSSSPTYQLCPIPDPLN